MKGLGAALVGGLAFTALVGAEAHGVETALAAFLGVQKAASAASDAGGTAAGLQTERSVLRGVELNGTMLLESVLGSLKDAESTHASAPNSTGMVPILAEETGAAIDAVHLFGILGMDQAVAHSGRDATKGVLDAPEEAFATPDTASGGGRGCGCGGFGFLLNFASVRHVGMKLLLVLRLRGCVVACRGNRT